MQTGIRAGRALLWLAPALVVASGLTVATASRADDDVESFYKDKSMKMVIGYGAGGGYDIPARVLIHHLGDHIPGHPHIIPQNMPGAGSLKAMNWVYAVAPRDGTVLGAVNRSLAIAPLLETVPSKREKLKFDAMKVNWLGSIDKAISIAICRKDSGFTAFDQFLKREAIETAAAPNSDSVVFATVFNKMLSTKFRIISGHQGTGANLLALQRKEADCHILSYSSLASSHPDWLQPGSPVINVVVQVGTEKIPALPHVPLIMDYADGKQRQALTLLFAPQVMGRPHFTTPDVPAERLQALRAAYTETMKDPKFLAEAKKTGLEVDAISGQDIENLLRGLYATDPSVVKMLQDAMPKKG